VTTFGTAGSTSRELDDVFAHPTSPRVRTQLMRGIPNARDLASLRALQRHLTEGRVQIKLFTRRPLHGKTYLCHREDINSPIVGFLGSSNLTMAGLKHNYELNVDVMDFDAAAKLDTWFRARWEDNFTTDITANLIEIIEESWAAEKPCSPYEVYLKVSYHLSRDVREGLIQYSVPPIMREQLLASQVNAVQTLARRVLTRGGTMLGDVVVLGKTITAVAVALMLREEHGHSTLVICPKNLVKMWEGYLGAYDVPGRRGPRGLPLLPAQPVKQQLVRAFRLIGEEQVVGAGDHRQRGARDQLGDPASVGRRHQPVQVAVHDQHGRRDGRQPLQTGPERRPLQLGQVAGRCAGQRQAHRPVLLDPRSRRPGGVVERDRQLRRLLRGDLAPVAQQGQGFGVPDGVGGAGMGAREHQRAHPLRRAHRHLLRDQTTHGDADHVGSGLPGLVEHRKHVRRHGLHRVRHAGHVAGAARSPVVQPDHPVPLRKHRADPEPHVGRVGQPHDQDHRLALALAGPPQARAVRALEDAHDSSASSMPAVAIPAQVPACGGPRTRSPSPYDALLIPTR